MDVVRTEFPDAIATVPVNGMTTLVLAPQRNATAGYQWYALTISLRAGGQVRVLDVSIGSEHPRASAIRFAIKHASNDRKGTVAQAVAAAHDACVAQLAANLQNMQRDAETPGLAL